MQSFVPGSTQGRLSIVVTGNDLAGNPLQSGGFFGADNDAATILVELRQATLLDMNTLDLDTIEGNLFPWSGTPFTLRPHRRERN
jgi:hypothetical protein